MQCTREEFGIAMHGSCNDAVALNDACVVCAERLQTIAGCFSKFWAFSIALDPSTHQRTSYLDVVVRFKMNSVLHNFHCMESLLYEQHTARRCSLLLPSPGPF